MGPALEGLSIFPPRRVLELNMIRKYSRPFLCVPHTFWTWAQEMRIRRDNSVFQSQCCFDDAGQTRRTL